MSEIPVETDVVVIGSGAAGMAAAVTAAEGGAKVVVFEKQRSLGGTTNFLHGTFAAESDMQRERFIDFTRDEAFRHIMDYSHWKANPWLVRAIVDESGATIQWLQDRGVVFTDASINMLGSPADVSRRQGQRRGHRQGPRHPGEEQRGRHPAGGGRSPGC